METINIKVTNGMKDGEFAVLYKQGRKLLGWTQRWRDGMWHNHKNGYSFSASETLARAVDVMKEHLCDTLDMFGNKKIIFQMPEE
jgi:hypothetical protein